MMGQRKPVGGSNWQGLHGYWKMAMRCICFLCFICLMGCSQKTAGTDSTVVQASARNWGTEMTKADDVSEAFMVDDLLECIDMLGKTATEIGLPRETVRIEMKYHPRAEIIGNIFGAEGSATLHFYDVRDSEDDYVARRLWIFTQNLNFDECRERLSEKFGNPLAEGEIPYAVVNHGAVTWADYHFQDICLRLSSASEDNFIRIEIEKSED